MTTRTTSGSTSNSSKTSEEYKVVPSAEDTRRAGQLVNIVTYPGKGKSLVARRDIPAWTLLGPYPGTRYTFDQYIKRQGQGLTDGKFGVDFWRVASNGRPSYRYIIDPGDDRGNLLPEFAKAVTPLANEPTTDKLPNLVWVWNIPEYRIEMWTNRAVAAGEELTICYGSEYSRRYKTSCTRKGVEPVMHVITWGHPTPVPHTDELRKYMFRRPTNNTNTAQSRYNNRKSSGSQTSGDNWQRFVNEIGAVGAIRNLIRNSRQPNTPKNTNKRRPKRPRTAADAQAAELALAYRNEMQRLQWRQAALAAGGGTDPVAMYAALSPTPQPSQVQTAEKETKKPAALKRKSAARVQPPVPRRKSAARVQPIYARPPARKVALTSQEAALQGAARRQYHLSMPIYVAPQPAPAPAPRPARRRPGPKRGAIQHHGPRVYVPPVVMWNSIMKNETIDQLTKRVTSEPVPYGTMYQKRLRFLVDLVMKGVLTNTKGPFTAADNARVRQYIDGLDLPPPLENMSNNEKNNARRNNARNEENNFKNGWNQPKRGGSKRGKPRVHVPKQVLWDSVVGRISNDEVLKQFGVARSTFFRQRKDFLEKLVALGVVSSTKGAFTAANNFRARQHIAQHYVTPPAQA